MNQSQWDKILKPEFKKMKFQRQARYQVYVSRGLCTQKEANRLVKEAGEPVEKHTLDFECPNWWD